MKNFGLDNLASTHIESEWSNAGQSRNCGLNFAKALHRIRRERDQISYKTVRSAGNTSDELHSAFANRFVGVEFNCRTHISPTLNHRLLLMPR